MTNYKLYSRQHFKWRMLCSVRSDRNLQCPRRRSLWMVLHYTRRKMLRYTRRETVDTNTGWREGETGESCWCQAGLTWGLGAGAGLFPHLRHAARLTHPGIAAALAGLCKEGTCYRYQMSAIQTGRHDNSASFNLLYQSQVTMPTRTRLVRFKCNIWSIKKYFW